MARQEAHQGGRQLIRAAENVIRAVALALAFVAGVALLLMMLQTVIDVTMNNLFGGPIEGNLEIMSVYHMVALVFLPLAIVELKHEHINVDLLVRLFPSGLRRITDTVGYLVSAVFFGMLMWQTWIDAVESFAMDEILMTSILITIWPAKFSLPIGFAAVMLASLLHAWKAASGHQFDPTPATPSDPS
jgi:TRAP-type C4-dicarboxylate transport system permease small subunit